MSTGLGSEGVGHITERVQRRHPLGVVAATYQLQLEPRCRLPRNPPPCSHPETKRCPYGSRPVHHLEMGRKQKKVSRVHNFWEAVVGVGVAAVDGSVTLSRGRPGVSIPARHLLSLAGPQVSCLDKSK